MQRSLGNGAQEHSEAWFDARLSRWPDVERTILEPPLRFAPEPVSEFQEATAGKELARIGRIGENADQGFWHLLHRASSRIGMTMGPPAPNLSGGLLACDAKASAARTSDSRYARPQRPYRRCSRAKRRGTSGACLAAASSECSGSKASSMEKCGRARPWWAAIRCRTRSRTPGSRLMKSGRHNTSTRDPNSCR